MLGNALQSDSPGVGPFVDGAHVAPAEDATIEIIDPSRGAPIFSIPAGSAADIERAVASARSASNDGRWRDMAPSARKSVLHGWADAIHGEATALDALDAEEMGKPVSLQLFNAYQASRLTRFCAEAIDKIAGQVFTSDQRSFAAQRLVPRGVIGAITPWNFPTYNAALKAAPALAAGNCVVIKPSEMSSRSVLRLAELALCAGLPPGTLNVVPGAGATAGRALSLHPDVDMITFTGSTEVGKQILQYAGQSNLKVVNVECGGKSPHIVFLDADIPAAARMIAELLVSNQGQICSVGSRLLVDRAIESKVVEAVNEHLRNIVPGNALDPRTTFGPLASRLQMNRALDFVKNAEVDGAELMSGGGRLLEDSGGYFFQPTIFRRVRPNAALAQQEIFAPILAVTAFADEAEAIALANGTQYALAAYVWTTDLSRAFRMSTAIRSTVIINAATPSGEGPGQAASSEPAKHSGLGIEGGLDGVMSFMRRQLLLINHA